MVANLRHLRDFQLHVAAPLGSQFLMLRFPTALVFGILLTLVIDSSASAGFDLTFDVSDAGGFTPSQLAQLREAVSYAEELWEGTVTGYASGIDLSGISITVIAGSDFADATVTETADQAGFRLSTTGRIRVSPAIIDKFWSWDGSGPSPANTEFQGVNYLDDIVAHEVGHVLGVGPQWTGNGVYASGSGEYTGPYGLAAYQAEFDADATFVPVELAGSSGTVDTHWNQLMRSSAQEGIPSDPWSLDPRIGITDSRGRDLGLELMTGAIDPDYGEPFLSMTSVQSLRDLGFTVVPEPASAILILFGATAFLGRTVRKHH